MNMLNKADTNTPAAQALLMSRITAAPNLFLIQKNNAIITYQNHIII